MSSLPARTSARMDYFDVGKGSLPSRIWVRLHAIVTAHKIPWRAVTGRTRIRDVVRCRREVCVVLRDEFGWSYDRIGALINKDHTSVYWAIRTAFPDREYKGVPILTPEKVREIRLRKGERARDVGAEYGVSRDAITAVWRGASWSSVV